MFGAALQNPIDDVGGVLDEMLAVVDDERQTAGLQILQNNVHQRTPSILAKSEGRGNGLGCGWGFVERRQLDEPDAIAGTFE